MVKPPWDFVENEMEPKTFKIGAKVYDYNDCVRLESEIKELSSKLDAKKNLLCVIREQCNHSWTPTQYICERLDGDLIVANPRWIRFCIYCNKEQTTYKSRQEVVEVPVFPKDDKKG